jgi:hypothetical protein
MCREGSVGKTEPVTEIEDVKRRFGEIRANSGTVRVLGEPAKIRVEILDPVRPVACGWSLAVRLRAATRGSTTGITGG